MHAHSHIRRGENPWPTPSPACSTISSSAPVTAAPISARTSVASSFPNLYGVVENAGAHLLKGGAAEDHVHLLIAAKPTHAPAELARVAKANSSRWIGGTWLDLHGFAWQGGYGAFSVSESSADKVAAYIEEQEQHHRRVGFAEELRALLERHGVAYDPQHYLE